jgi:hypothetical protein
MSNLVLAFVVEDVDKLIEAGLLLKRVGRRGLGGFFFQGEMHAFMTAVLLGMARLDAFDADSQTQPPDGKLAQVEQNMRGSERHSVLALGHRLLQKRSHPKEMRSSAGAVEMAAEPVLEVFA